ncbi:MAG: DUF1934 family protein [Lactobacillus sp.]|nr:DUF1934 family protein [Lactobacillus sp.]
MRTSKYELISKITQENESETFSYSGECELEKSEHAIKVRYDESPDIHVEMMAKPDRILLKRSSDRHNYSLLRLNLDEKASCKVVAAGREMDLSSLCKKIDIGKKHVYIEYNLYTGLYLVGNYEVTLQFK